MINNSYSLSSYDSNNLKNLDLSIFYDKKSNIEVTENHLKYNTCLYYIDHMSNQNANTQPKTSDVDFNDLANLSIIFSVTLCIEAARSISFWVILDSGLRGGPPNKLLNFLLVIVKPVAKSKYFMSNLKLPSFDILIKFFLIRLAYIGFPYGANPMILYSPEFTLKPM